MAIGTLTPVKGAHYRVSNKRCRVYDVQLTAGANYTTGGETIKATDVGLRGAIDQVHVMSNPKATGGAIGALAVDYGSTAGASPSSVKLVAYFSTNGAADTQVSANTDLSGYTVRCVFIGA